MDKRLNLSINDNLFKVLNRITQNNLGQRWNIKTGNIVSHWECHSDNI